MKSTVGGSSASGEETLAMHAHFHYRIRTMHPGGVNHMIIDWLPIDTSEKNTTITQLSLTACLTEFHPKSCTSHSSKRRDSSDILLKV